MLVNRLHITNSSSNNTGCNCNEILIIHSICSKGFQSSSGSISRNVSVSNKMISSNSSGNNNNIGFSYFIKSIKRNNEYYSSTNYN